MNIITVPAWEERIDIKPLTPRAKAALARYYAAEMIGELSLQGDCDELAVVLGVAPEYNPLQMIEGWILHRLRFVCEVDARGHRCPTPTLRLRRALAGVAAGEIVELIADDPMARIDVPHFTRESGHDLIDIADQLGVMRFKVKKKG